MQQLLAMLIALCFLSSVMPLPSIADGGSPTAYAETAVAEESATLNFSNTEITETVSGSGYKISGTALTISSAGTYRITGSCSEGSITVSGQDITLILDSLSLTSATTAPIIVKKSCATVIKLEGTSTVINDEDPANSEEADFEGAAIKFKGSSALTISGDGTLVVKGNAKNGIKGGSGASLIINGGTLDVTALNNGIASDGSLVVNGGNITVNSDNDGIKSDPDEGDIISAGTVEINGGTVTVSAKGDGIQAGTALTITGGTFDITTLNGYDDTTFDSDTMSCKGLKASGSDPDANTLTVTAGTFKLNTADDAVHSDGDVTITGGTFEIWTGDDGVHSDTTLTLGTQDGYERDPEITVYASYEGLEGANIYAFSGKYYIVSSDDGINAAGGNDGSGNAGPGGGGNFRPGEGCSGRMSPGGSTSASTYNMYFYGGIFFVNAEGDGLDSNGGLYLYGGTVTVFGQAQGGDNSPLDSDGILLIKGATVFASGSNPMSETPSSSSQYYYSDKISRTTNTIVTVTYNGKIVYTEKLIKQTNYLLYSSSSVTSSSGLTISTGGGVDNCKSNAWAHNWGNGEVTRAATAEESGVMTYACQDCKTTERQTIPALFTVSDDESGSGGDRGETGECTASFITDAHATINVYYTQDYITPSATDVTTAIARNSTTGEPDGTGNGQINFEVVLENGYIVDSVTVEGDYKSLKGSEDTGLENYYRITKITGNLTITVKTKKEDEDGLMGDLDADGAVTAQDALVALRITVGLENMTDRYLRLGDFDQSGNISAVDALEILRIVVGISEYAK